MVVNLATKKLIKDFEGLRLKAYRCSAGVLTIGWGHTSAAGEPVVKAGMAISKAEAARIFDNDIEKFAAGIEKLIKAEVNENQFGAMVSLAFNIGVGAFARSSVLRFVNQRRFDDAADAFMLWNKVNKKAVAGLTRRRASEAALFKTPVGDEGDEDIRLPDAPEGKKMMLSSTNLAAGATAAAGLSAAAKEVVDNTASVFAMPSFLTIGLILVIVAGAAWIIRERWMKSRDWAV